MLYLQKGPTLLPPLDSPSSMGWLKTKWEGACSTPSGVLGLIGEPMDCRLRSSKFGDEPVGLLQPVLPDWSLGFLWVFLTKVVALDVLAPLPGLLKSFFAIRGGDAAWSRSNRASGQRTTLTLWLALLPGWRVNLHWGFVEGLNSISPLNYLFACLWTKLVFPSVTLISILQNLANLGLY